MTDAPEEHSEGASMEGLRPLPAGLLTVDHRPGIAHAGGMRRYEPIQWLPDGEHRLYTQAALDAVAAAERERYIAEIERLRAALAASCDEHRSQMYEAGPGGGCPVVRDAVAAERKDAERYRWLRDNPQWLGWEHDFRPDEVEREIDAAMAGLALRP